MSLNKDFLIKLPVNAEIKLKLEGNRNKTSCVMAPARCLTGGGEKNKKGTGRASWRTTHVLSTIILRWIKITPMPFLRN